MTAAAIGAFIGGLLALLLVQYIIAGIFLLKPLRAKAMLGFFIGAAITLMLVINQTVTMGSYDLWLSWLLVTGFMYWRTRRLAA
ncbi:MAG: hypothetical protein L6Q72_20045, partial [Burkholderiaceae bacterium]|nr:hypothetical protein [Burkholderiaceae bacterium]